MEKEICSRAEFIRHFGETVKEGGGVATIDSDGRYEIHIPVMFGNKEKPMLLDRGNIETHYRKFLQYVRQQEPEIDLER